MICDVSSILKVTGAKISVDEHIAELKGESENDYVFTDVSVKGEIVNIGDVLEFGGEISGRFQTECARCLKPTEVKFCVEFTEMLKNVDGEISDKDAVVIFEGNTVELSEIIRSNILVNLATKYLCSEDCKGICPVCGADLNESDCGCVNDYIDPRLEGLKKLLDENREV